MRATIALSNLLVCLQTRVVGCLRLSDLIVLNYLIIDYFYEIGGSYHR